MTFSFLNRQTRFHKKRKRRNDFMNSVEKIKHKAFNSSVVFYGVRKSFFSIFFGVRKVLYINREIFFVFYHGGGVERLWFLNISNHKVFQVELVGTVAPYRPLLAPPLSAVLPNQIRYFFYFLKKNPIFFISFCSR